MILPDRETTGFSDIGSRVRRAYTLALCLVGALSIGAFLALDSFIARQGDTASIINVAGKQRMLSQRIVHLSHQLLHGDGPAQRDEERLRAAVDGMTAAHEALLAGDADRHLPGIRSATERTYYFAEPHDIDARVRAFLTDARALPVERDPGRRADLVARIDGAERAGLLGALDAVVVHHEHRARTNARRAERVHLALLLSTIAILFIEARLVFAPLVRELLGKEKAVRHQQAELIHASLHDQLTGLFNRHHLQAFARSLAAGSARAGAGGYSLVALDIDNFKNVNDAHGHEAGDRLLRTVAERILANIRDTDLAFRIGGDEFLVCIDSADPRLAHDIAERLGADLRASLSTEPGCSAVAASIGIASAPGHGCSLDEVHASADIALYHTKSIGKNAVTVFHAELRTAFQQRRADEAFVREALHADAFEPHFQPQVDMRTARVTGVEVLARCRDAEGDLVQPGRFLPVAERTGLIVPLGEQVIDRAVRIATGWIERGLPFGRLAINASSAQLRDPGFVDFLAATLARHGYPGDRLSIEILETVMVDDDDTVVKVVEALQASGAWVELDDFGTGHTSIASLDRLAIDRIKVDRSFVAAIDADDCDARVLEVILTMARSLGVEAIAEGIETDLQRRRLIELGCPTGQGFLLARPMGEHDTGRWLEEAAVATAVPAARGRWTA